MCANFNGPYGTLSEADGTEDAQKASWNMFTNRGEVQCALTGLTVYGIIERVYDFNKVTHLAGFRTSQKVAAGLDIGHAHLLC